jgi:hypothetical protein
MPHKTPEDSKILATLGINYISVPEAAKLVCTSEYFLGKLEDISDLNEDDFYGEKLDKALAPHIEKMIPRFLSAGLNQTLPVITLKRHSDESFIPEETYINLAELEEWLDERGMYLESQVSDKFYKNHGELLSVAIEAIETEKFRQDNTDSKVKRETNLDEVIHKQKIDALKEERIKLENQPINSKAKNSLLTIIFAIAVKKYHHDPTAAQNSSTAKIRSTVEELGLSIDDDTIRKWLRQAADALDGEYELPNRK